MPLAVADVSMYACWVVLECLVCIGFNCLEARGFRDRGRGAGGGEAKATGKLNGGLKNVWADVVLLLFVAAAVAAAVVTTAAAAAAIGLVAVRWSCRT